GQFAGKRAHDLVMPGPREATTGAEIGKDEVAGAAQRLDLGNLGLQTLTPFVELVIRPAMARIKLADDGKNRHLEQDGVQPGAADANRELAVFLVDVDKA